MPKIGAKKADPAPNPDYANGGSLFPASYSRAIYFDPGERYTGVAMFERDELDDTWNCYDARTWDIEEQGDIEQLWAILNNTSVHGYWDIVGYEVFRLFEDKAQQQKGSEFVASQTIGAIRWIVHRNQYTNRWPRQPIELVRFLPDHKKAVAGIMRKRGISFEADRRHCKGDHARDAELQGFFDLVNTRGFEYRRKEPIG